MSLNYDFDMYSASPKEVFSDPTLDAVLREIRTGNGDKTHRIALFRDPRTVAALNAAPEPLKRYLVESGFGLTQYDSGAPPGCYWASEEDARLMVMEKMAENMNKFDLPKARDMPEGGFSLADLTARMIEAEPVDDRDMAEAARLKGTPAPEPVGAEAAPEATPAAGTGGDAARSGAAAAPSPEARIATAEPREADSDRLPQLAAADADEDAIASAPPRRILGQIVSGALLAIGLGLLAYAVLGVLL